MSTRSDLGPNWSLYVKMGSDQCAGSSCKGPDAALAVVIYGGWGAGSGAIMCWGVEGAQAGGGGEMHFH